MIRVVEDVWRSLSCTSERCCAVGDGAVCWNLGDLNEPEFGTVLCSGHVMVGRAVRLAVGDLYGCAADAAGEGFCWRMDTFERVSLGAVRGVVAHGDKACYRSDAGWLCAGRGIATLSLGSRGRSSSSETPFATRYAEGFSSSAYGSFARVWGADGMSSLAIGEGDVFCGGSDSVSCWGSDLEVLPGVEVLAPTLAASHTDAIWGVTESQCAAVASATTAAGGSTVCAPLANGTAGCWTNGDDGTDANEFFAVRFGIDEVTDVVEVAVADSAGSIVVCARRLSGGVRCGNADGSVDYSLLAIARHLGCHAGVCCAVDLISGGLCWDALTAAVRSETLDESIIALGGMGRCAAVGLDGTVRCAQLDGSGLTRFDLGARVVDLSVGASHACATLDYGVVRCWGDNDNGQLGRPTSSNSVFGPGVVVPNVENALVVRAEADWSCALEEDGGVLCWGYRGPGHDAVAAAIPLDVPFSAVAMSSGSGGLCLTSALGEVHCEDSIDVYQDMTLSCMTEEMQEEEEPVSSSSRLYTTGLLLFLTLVNI